MTRDVDFVIDLEEAQVDEFVHLFEAAEDLLLSKLLWAETSRSDLQLGNVRNLILSERGFDWAYIERWAQKLGVVDLLNEVRSEDV